jgi:hypothetical protein
MDCFTLRVRNDGSVGRLYESSFPLFALLNPRNNSAGDGEDLWYMP